MDNDIWFFYRNINGCRPFAEVGSQKGRDVPAYFGLDGLFISHVMIPFQWENILGVLIIVVVKCECEKGNMTSIELLIFSSKRNV